VTRRRCRPVHSRNSFSPPFDFLHLRLIWGFFFPWNKVTGREFRHFSHSYTELLRYSRRFFCDELKSPLPPSGYLGPESSRSLTCSHGCSVYPGIRRDAPANCRPPKSQSTPSPFWLGPRGRSSILFVFFSVFKQKAVGALWPRSRNYAK